MGRYSQNRYDFVIDSSFRPFSMQEMMAPLAMYKEAYEKAEEQYVDLQDKANKFKYLSTTLPEDSEARQLYEGYANDLKAQAEDLVRNGLNIGNRRALTDLRGRYSGEIGMLAEAKENLNKERELRRQMSAKDPSMLFEDDDLTIDKYLYGRTPSNYGISGTELYTKAATSAQAISKRVFNAGDGGKTLGGYYRDYVQRMGYTPEQLSKFGEQISADFANWAATNIPELGMAANQILEANGVNEHLSGNNLKKAQTQVIRGLIDGAVYTENHNPTRDPGTPSQSEKWQHELSVRSQLASEAMNGISWVDNKPVYNKDNDLTLQRQLQAIQERARVKAEAGASGASGSRSSSGYGAINQQGVRVSWRGNNPNDLNGDADNDVNVTPLDKDVEYTGDVWEYDDLPQYAKNKVDKIVGRKGDIDNYIIYFKPYRGGFFGDTEAELDVVPKKIQKDDISDDEDLDMEFGGY